MGKGHHSSEYNEHLEMIDSDEKEKRKSGGVHILPPHLDLTIIFEDTELVGYRSSQGLLSGTWKHIPSVVLRLGVPRRELHKKGTEVSCLPEKHAIPSSIDPTPTAIISCLGALSGAGHDKGSNSDYIDSLRLAWIGINCLC